jgi:preprotein translocase subunit YajC
MENFLTLAAQFAGPLILFVSIYIFAILPHRRKIKQHRRLIDSLKPNDQVVTTAGIHGRLIGRSKNVFLLEVAPDVKFEVESSKIESIIERQQASEPKYPSWEINKKGQTTQAATTVKSVGVTQGAPSTGGAVGQSFQHPKKCVCGAQPSAGDHFCGVCGRGVSL